MSHYFIRYKFVITLLIVTLIILFISPEIGVRSIKITTYSLTEMLVIIPPIFVLLGLLDVWVPQETVIKLMGRDSGMRGILLAFMMGSFAAGPLYAAFPIAAALMKKGSKFSNVLIFIGAWSTTKIPMLLFEAGAIGVKYMLLRLAINIPGILIMAFFIESIISEKEKRLIYQQDR